MSDNSWHENGFFPPVGTECEFFWGEHPVRWLKVLITDSGLDCGRECVVLRQGDEIRISIDWRHFRPIKTERELAIEAAWSAIDHLGYTYSAIKEIAGALFDIGLLRSKNES